MTDREQEIERIVKRSGTVEFSAFPYEGLPQAEPTVPLVKRPEQTVLTEKIGNTEYTLNAHFKKEGRDLLCYLTRLIETGVGASE